jgi:GTP cyclohydrolase I
MTHEIADSLQAMLGAHGPRWCSRRSTCAQMRGVREHKPTTRTTAYRGTYVADPALRSEFFTLAAIGRRGQRR